MSIHNHRYVLPVEISDLRAFDDSMYEKLMAYPLDGLKVMEDALHKYLKEKSDEYPIDIDQEWQIILKSDDHPVKIREITSNRVSNLFVVSGIIISATKPYIKASKLKLQCKYCENPKTIELQPGQWPYVPTHCEGRPGSSEKCPKDPFVALPTSQVIDCQNMKIQELPD